MDDDNSKDPTQAYNDDPNNLMTFPCDFIVKAITKNNKESETTLIELVQKHFPDYSAETIIKRPSKDNNFCAYTISLYIEKKETLDSLYQDLSDSPIVLMAL